MKTDRELLELAAKAAGIKAKWFKVKKWKDYNGARWLIGSDDIFGTHHSKPWNPLTDDGDALRLAVKLGMEISLWGSSIHCKIGSIAFTQEPVGTDRAESVREAIVKTAIKYAENKP
jgi:hypothetical protein